MEMSKHVAIYIMQIDTRVIYGCALVGCNKKDCPWMFNLLDTELFFLVLAHPV